MKYGIYIVSGETNKIRLFAVAVSLGYVTYLRNAAKKTIPQYSSDWVCIRNW